MPASPKTSFSLPLLLAIFAGLLVGVLVYFVFFFDSDHEFGTAPTPEGYVKVGEDLSCKKMGNQTLWYDNYQRKSLPVTVNDGSCPG